MNLFRKITVILCGMLVLILSGCTLFQQKVHPDGCDNLAKVDVQAQQPQKTDSC